MKKLTWLLELADKKPLLYLVAILMIAISVMATVVTNRQLALANCQEKQDYIQRYYNQKIDSIVGYYIRREASLNAEVKQTLNAMIADYKERLDAQKRFNEEIVTTIKENNKIINKTDRK